MRGLDIYFLVGSWNDSDRANKQMITTIPNIETTITYGELEKRVEAARKAGYDEGYKVGASDMSHILKFGEIDFEPKATNKICDAVECGAEFFGTDSEAKDAGWSLMIGSEWCPAHR